MNSAFSQSYETSKPPMCEHSRDVQQEAKCSETNESVGM